jgi:MFS superfamily sulfate permease-like transporter
MTLAGYRAAWLSADLIAGLVLAAIAIPEQLATARLAGMPAQTGLYAFIAGSLAFAALGANRYLSVGADSTIAPIFAGSLAAFAGSGSPEYAALVGFVALAAGALLLAAGALHAGWIADLLSVPVTAGFLAGISVHIIAGQLPAFLGIAQTEGTLPQRLLAILAGLPATNWYAAGTGLLVLLATLLAERVNPRIPGALLGLAGAAVAAATLGFAHRGVAMLGALPSGFAHPALPLLDAQHALKALPVAAIVALVCMVQTSATVRSFPSDPGAEPEDVSRDFAAVGVGSLLASVLGSFAVDASPPRTAVVLGSGGRTQLASITAASVIAALIAFGAGLPAYLPQSALAGVLIFIGMRIFRTRDMLDVARRGGPEIWFVIAAAVLVVVLPIETGMLLSIALSLGQGVYNVARPPSAQLLQVPGTTIWWRPEPGSGGRRVPGLLVFAPAAPIVFTNANFMIERLRAAIAAAPDPVRLVVLECEGVLYIDYTGSQELQREIGALHARGVRVSIARLEDPRAQAAAERTGLLATLGPASVYKSVYEALAAAKLDP